MSPPHPPEISLVIPVYNEEENLPILEGEIRVAMEAAGRPYEVIYVDDGSSDGSPEVLRALAREDPRIRVIRQKRNHGQSAALDAGFRHARGDVVVTLDADLQNDPADIPRLLERIDEYDVVSGVRAKRRDSWVRKMSSRIANGVRNRVTHESVTDVGCTLRACRTEFLRRIPVFNGMHRFLPTLLRMEGARVTEVPVNHRPRLHGQPKYNIRNRLFRALADLYGVRWMQTRWVDRGLSRGDRRLDTKHIWLAVGFFGQALFFGRFFVQWIASERRKESVIPRSFWFLSLGGGLILLLYSIHRRDPVFIVGQATGMFIYTRNLWFIYRPRTAPPP